MTSGAYLCAGTSASEEHAASIFIVV